MKHQTTRNGGPAHQMLLNDVAEMLADIDITLSGYPYFSHLCHEWHCSATATFIMDSNRILVKLTQRNLDREELQATISTARDGHPVEQIAHATFDNDPCGTLTATFVAAILNQYTAERDLQ